MKYNTRLVYSYDDDTGDHGWTLKRNKHFNPCYSAGAVVHDILEHSRNDKGTWYEEIAAFGASVAYRGDGSELLYPRLILLPDKIEALGKELGDLLEFPFINRSDFFSELPKTKTNTDNELIKLLANTASETLESHLPEFNKNLAYNCLLKWLSFGYNRALSVINNSGHEPYYIWSCLRYEIDNALFDTRYNFYENNEVSIQYDLGTLACNVIPINCKRVFN